MIRASSIFLLLAGILSATYVQAQSVSGSVNGDGFIVLSGDVALLALELKSPRGHLIPIADDNPSPFELLLSNTEEEVFLGIVGAENAISIDGGLVLNVGYDTSGTFDLQAEWGGPIEGQEGLVSFETPGPLVPEPSTGFLATAALTGLLVVQNRRRRHGR